MQLIWQKGEDPGDDSKDRCGDKEAWVSSTGMCRGGRGGERKRERIIFKGRSTMDFVLVTEIMVISLKEMQTPKITIGWRR